MIKEQISKNKIRLPSTLLKVSLVNKLGVSTFFCDGSPLIKPAKSNIAMMIPDNHSTNTLSKRKRWYKAVMIILAMVAMDVAIINGTNTLVGLVLPPPAL